MSAQAKTEDLSGKRACQLHPNPDFLSEADFIADDGSYREYKLVIKAITREELQLPGRSAKEPKVVIAFEKATKRLVLNKTNTAAIKSHYGKQVKDWLGQPVVVHYDPTVRFGKDVVGGVRIRSKA